MDMMGCLHCTEIIFLNTIFLKLFNALAVAFLKGLLFCQKLPILQ